jgi:hypothetical protein
VVTDQKTLKLKKNTLETKVQPWKDGIERRSKEKEFDVLGRKSIDLNIEKLRKKILNCPNPREGDIWKSCVNYAKEIIQHWIYTGNTKSMLNALLALQDRETIIMFIRDTLSQNFSSNIGKTLASVCDNFGWDSMFDCVSYCFKNNSKSVHHCVAVLYDMMMVSKGDKQSILYEEISRSIYDSLMMQGAKPIQIYIDGG